MIIFCLKSQAVELWMKYGMKERIFHMLNIIMENQNQVRNFLKKHYSNP